MRDLKHNRAGETEKIWQKKMGTWLPPKGGSKPKQKKDTDTSNNYGSVPEWAKGRGVDPEKAKKRVDELHAAYVLNLSC